MNVMKRRYWIINNDLHHRVGPFANKHDAEKGRTQVKKVTAPDYLILVGEHESTWEAFKALTPKVYNRREYDVPKQAHHAA